MQAGHSLADGRYTLDHLIQRSGMGEVWLANQNSGVGFSKQVVIKMISSALTGEDEAHQRFFDEARIASRINHPHVVQLYDFGKDNTTGALFLAMEYIHGHDLSAIVERAIEKRTKLPFSIICRILADACQGLGYIHDLTDERGRPLELVHRDISPSNMLVSTSGGVKIIDFGIAKAREKKSRTRTGVIVGKLQYMSPEQLSSAPVDLRSDLYSMGLVFYELLTLERRFRGNNLLEVYYEALHNPPPQITDLRPHCPPEIVSACQRALSTNADQRFRTAYEFQEVLESYLRKLGETVSQRQIAMYLEDLFSDKPVDDFEKEELNETTRVHPFANAGFHRPPAQVDIHQPDSTDFDLDSTFTSMPPMMGGRDEERTDINVSPLSPSAVSSARISQDSQKMLDHTFSGALDDYLRGDSLAADDNPFEDSSLFQTNPGMNQGQVSQPMEEATRVLPSPTSPRPSPQARRPQEQSRFAAPSPSSSMGGHNRVHKAVTPDPVEMAMMQSIDDDLTQPPVKIPRPSGPPTDAPMRRQRVETTQDQPAPVKRPASRPPAEKSAPKASKPPTKSKKKAFPWWMVGFALICLLTGVAIVVIYLLLR